MATATWIRIWLYRLLLSCRSAFNECHSPQPFCSNLWSHSSQTFRQEHVRPLLHNDFWASVCLDDHLLCWEFRSFLLYPYLFFDTTTTLETSISSNLKFGFLKRCYFQCSIIFGVKLFSSETYTNHLFPKSPSQSYNNWKIQLKFL